MQEKKNDKSKIVARVLVICAAALIVLAAAAGVILRAGMSGSGSSSSR